MGSLSAEEIWNLSPEDQMELVKKRRRTQLSYLVLSPRCTDEVREVLSDVKWSTTVHLSMAASPYTPGHILEKLAFNPSVDVKSMVAAHPNTPVQTLVKLANDPSFQVRVAVGKNPSTPFATLVQLSCVDEATKVRKALQPQWKAATRWVGDLPFDDLALAVPYLPRRDLVTVSRRSEVLPETLKYLAGVPYPEVIEGVAGNPRTPYETLMGLAKACPSPRVAYALVCNPVANSDMLRLAVNVADGYSTGVPGDFYIRLAAHPNTSPTILGALSHSSSKEVRVEVAKNSSTPMRVLEQLLSDSEDTVREALFENRKADEDFRLRVLASGLPTDALLRVAVDYEGELSRIACNKLSDLDWQDLSNLRKGAVQYGTQAYDKLGKIIALEGSLLARLNLAMFQGTSSEVLEILADDVSQAVRVAATSEQVRRKNVRSSFTGTQVSYAREDHTHSSLPFESSAAVSVVASKESLESLSPQVGSLAYSSDGGGMWIWSGDMWQQVGVEEAVEPEKEERIASSEYSLQVSLQGVDLYLGSDVDEGQVVTVEGYGRFEYRDGSWDIQTGDALKEVEEVEAVEEEVEEVSVLQTIKNAALSAVMEKALEAVGASPKALAAAQPLAPAGALQGALQDSQDRVVAGAVEKLLSREN